MFAVELGRHYVNNPTVYGMAWTSVTLCECDHELADVIEFEPPVATNADSTHVHHWFGKLAAAHLIFNFHFIPCIQYLEQR